jgi:Ca2+-binding EF-hand superfamily protein
MVSSISSTSSYLLSVISRMSPSTEQRKNDLFSKVDGNSDGSIDKTEFSELAKKLSERSGASVDAESAFSTYDADGNGTLSAEELDAFMKATAPPPPQGGRDAQGMQQRLDDLFGKIDSNGDSSLSKSEFTVFANKLSEDSGTTVNVDTIYSTYDKDGDGTLSESELDAFMKDNAPTPPSQMSSAGSSSGTDESSSDITALLQLLNNQEFTTSLSKLFNLVNQYTNSDHSSTTAVSPTV